MKDFEVVTKAGDGSLPSIHPSLSASTNTEVPGRNLPPHQGLDGLESKYRKCRQCGFINDTLKLSHGSGYGNEGLVAMRMLITTSNGNPITDGDGVPTYTTHATKKDIADSNGCGFCFSSEF